MWHEPYLETCCRSALHRLFLSGEAGRPPNEKDHPCLLRLSRMGLALPNDRRGRFLMTPAGIERHRKEILRIADQ